MFKKYYLLKITLVLICCLLIDNSIYSQTIQSRLPTIEEAREHLMSYRWVIVKGEGPGGSILVGGIWDFGKKMKRSTFGRVSGETSYEIVKVRSGINGRGYTLDVKVKDHDKMHYEEFYVNPVSIIVRRDAFSFTKQTEKYMYLELLGMEYDKPDTNSIEVRINKCSQNSGSSSNVISHELQILPSEKVRIANQIWTTKNATFDRFKNGDIICEARNSREWTEFWKNNIPCWSYYNYDPSTEKIYGKYYNIHVINDPRGIAPSGWRVPSLSDIQSLLKKNIRYSQLKASDKFRSPHMYNDVQFDDARIHSIGSGYNDRGNYIGQKTDWLIWGSAEGGGSPFSLHLYFRSRDKPSVSIESFHSQLDRGFSIRFVTDYSGKSEDLSTSEQLSSEMVDNAESILRKTEELKYLWTDDKLQTNVNIVSSPEDWIRAANEKRPACCYYNFNPLNRNMGLYYNWYALSTISFSRSRLPQIQDWLDLKSIDSNIISTSNDASIFNGYLGGYCDEKGVFYNKGIHGYWWFISNEVNNTVYLTNIDDRKGSLIYDNSKKGYGFSLRYIREERNWWESD
jgi:uncharacterized protein (TIGR02145 family)